MYFQSFQEFIHMGGHGFYVWLCYGVVLFALVGYFVYSKQLVKSNQKSLIKFYKRMETQQKNTSHPYSKSIEES